MQLTALIGPEIAAPAGLGSVEVTGITADSRKVRPGFLFAALPGAKTDGAAYVSDAVAKGAAAVLAALDAGDHGLGRVHPLGQLLLGEAELSPAHDHHASDLLEVAHRLVPIGVSVVHGMERGHRSNLGQ